MEKNIQCEKTQKLNGIIKLLFMSFIILQPIFDIYMCLFDEYVQIAGMSLATILRLGFVFVMTLLVMINTKKTKLTLCFAIYVAAILIYCVIHHFNAAGFGVSLPTAAYNPFQEIFYLIRMCIPPAIIYVVYNVKPTYKDVKKMLLSVSLIMSLVIIVSNLLEIGHVAYALEKVKIEDNMISWFTGTTAKWTLLTCRGFFQWTNQISAVMLIILPFLTFAALKEKRVWHWVVVVLHVIAMINIGTRIASVGCLLVLCATLFVYILEKLIHGPVFRKELKTVVCVVVSFAIVLTVFAYSPVIRRSQTEDLFGDLVAPGTTSSSAGSSSSTDTDTDADADKDQTSSDEADAPSDEDPVPDEEAKRLEKIQYIEENVATAGVQGLYIYTAYPYTQDVDFWYHIIKDVPESERSGNRNMRTYMINRILELDGRISNYIWGISYTRSSSFVWPERDIETHFDALGIVGCVLFIGPYFLGLIVGLWLFFKRFKQSLKLSCVIYLMCICLGLVNSYFSGHVMNELFPSIFLALIAGMTINNARATSEEIL